MDIALCDLSINEEEEHSADAELSYIQLKEKKKDEMRRHILRQVERVRDSVQNQINEAKEEDWVDREVMKAFLEVMKWVAGGYMKVKGGEGGDIVGEGKGN